MSNYHIGKSLVGKTSRKNGLFCVFISQNEYKHFAYTYLLDRNEDSLYFTLIKVSFPML